MNFNFSEVLTRAWKITWTHKSLWGLAFAMMFVTFLFFPLIFVPMFLILGKSDPTRWLENPLAWIGMALGFVMIMLVSYGGSPLIRSALAAGALKADRGAQKLSFGELFNDARGYYLRFLGVMLLLALVVTFISTLFAVFQTFAIFVTMGLASLCMMPLSFLMYPLIFAGTAWMELAESAIVVDGLGVIDSFRRAWETMRSNKMNIFILALIVYLGVGMVSGLVAFPFMLPMFAAPFFMLDSGNLSNAFLWGAGVWMVVFFPVMAFVQGIGMVFMKTVWVLTYLRLNPKPAENIIVVTEPNA